MSIIIFPVVLSLPMWMEIFYCIQPAFLRQWSLLNMHHLMMHYAWPDWLVLNSSDQTIWKMCSMSGPQLFSSPFVVSLVSVIALKSSVNHFSHPARVTAGLRIKRLNFCSREGCVCWCGCALKWHWTVFQRARCLCHAL